MAYKNTQVNKIIYFDAMNLLLSIIKATSSNTVLLL